MRILGIDPGSRVTGYGILEAAGNRIGVVDYGILRLPEKRPVTERLCELDRLLRRLVDKHDPDEVAIEEAFAAVNVRTALILGQVRGAAIVAVGAGAERPVFEYSPRSVKKAVVGYGQADKEQVALMMVRLLGLSEPPPQDAADALAVALCHIHSRVFTERLKSARG